MNELELLTKSRDSGQYVGIWIAMVDKEVVAKGEKLEDVLREAKSRKPGKEPFVTKLPKNRVMLL